jgi:hypothetical protein
MIAGEGGGDVDEATKGVAIPESPVTCSLADKHRHFQLTHIGIKGI